jgi:hypothetical protein
LKESRGYSGLKGAPLSGVRLRRRNQGRVPKLRTNDLQQMLANGARKRSNSLWIAWSPRQFEVVSLTRSRRETVTFRHPFRIRGIDRQLQAGAYEVVTDEELIEGLSFPCFRRVATMIMVPGAPPHHSSIEMISISSVDLADAQQADAVASHA